MIHHISDTAIDTSVDGILMLDADRWRTFRHTLLLRRPCVGHPWCPVDPVDPWPETWKTWHIWHLADPGTYVGPLETSWIQRDDMSRNSRSKWGDMPSTAKPCLIIFGIFGFLLDEVADTCHERHIPHNQSSLSRPAMRVQHHPYLRPAPGQLGGWLFNNIQEQYLLYYCIILYTVIMSVIIFMLSDCKKHCSGSFLWETCFSFSCSEERNWHKVREHNKLLWVEDAIFGMVLRWDLAKTTLSDTFRIQWNAAFAAHLCWHALAHRAGSSVVMGQIVFESVRSGSTILGMFENGVYPQWNSHLVGIIGIMIINHWVQWGTLFSDTPILNWSLSQACDDQIRKMASRAGRWFQSWHGRGMSLGCSASSIRLSAYLRVTSNTRQEPKAYDMYEIWKEMEKNTKKLQETWRRKTKRKTKRNRACESTKGRLKKQIERAHFKTSPSPQSLQHTNT